MTTMMANGMEFGEYDFPQRNRRATKTIEKYAAGHAAADIAIGLMGFLPIPGAALASIGAALIVQVPVYKCLAADLGRIYLAPSADESVNSIVNSGIARGSVLEMGASLGTDVLVEYFGADFIQEILKELAAEIGISLGISMVPILGGFISTGLDLVIAVSMTWRVGTMVSMYYQNGQQWPGGSRSAAYKRAKNFTGGLSTTNAGRLDLDDLAARDSAIRDHVAEKFSRFVEKILKLAPDTTDSKIHEMLRESKVPKASADKAIELGRKRFGDQGGR